MWSILKSPVWAAIGSCAALVAPTVASADTVIRRDGSQIEGSVVSLDASAVILTTSSGTMRVPRADVATISFTDVKPMKVEIRNVKSDDAVDVLVDGDEVIRDARDGGEWIDITSRLKDGNTPLRLRVHNDRGGWAYHLNVRLNGQVVPIECGTPMSAGRGCKEFGKTGTEVGIIDDIPPIWIHVDRTSGRAEILP